MSNHFTIKLIPLFLVFGFSHELSIFDTIIDGIIWNIFPIGEPLNENMNIMKFKCDGAKTGYFQTLFESLRYGFDEEGLLGKVALAILRDGVNPDTNLICALLKEGEWKKAQTIIKEYNKHLSNTKTVISQFKDFLKDASKENTSVTFPTFICMIRQFQTKYPDLFPETGGARIFAKNLFDNFYGSITAVLESATEMGAKECKLPPPPTQQSEYRSDITGLKIAIENLESKLKNSSGKTSHSWGIFG